MPKKILVNGRNIWVEEADFDDVREMFKENVTVDDLDEWTTVKEMEQYTATTFINKARYYLSLSPPDLVQSAEKIWFSAVYAVKELYLSSGGVDLKSHNSLKYFCFFALKCFELPYNHFWNLTECWTKAEKMHQDVYGSVNFHTDDYKQIISDVETFVLEFAKFDRKKLWAEFYKTFIVGNDPDVKIKKATVNIKLGGFNYKCNYSVFV